MEYEILRDPTTGKCFGVRRMSDGANIPKNENNRDWRAFLEWNALQTTGLPIND